MKISELLLHLEKWAPPGIAWAKDNVGLQVGDARKPLKNILLCVDFSEEVLKEAITKKCNLIISHHPLLFHPLKNFTPETNRTAALIQALLKNSISLVSYHTNLDFTKGGVNSALSSALRLQKTVFLDPLEDLQSKIVVFVPEDSLERVRTALFRTGAGSIGDYDECSYTLEGTGTFRGNELSTPAAGTKGIFERVPEVRLEMLCDNFLLNKAIAAIKATHPYEEPAYDIIPVKNKHTRYGSGMIGSLEYEMTEYDFLEFVKAELDIPYVRYATGTGKPVLVVAVCGGSGSTSLRKAIAAGADAFVTADITYHTFQEAENKILLIDAGHFETERTVLPHLQRKIQEFISAGKPKLQVYVSGKEMNPVRYF